MYQRTKVKVIQLLNNPHIRTNFIYFVVLMLTLIIGIGHDWGG